MYSSLSEIYIENFEVFEVLGDTDGGRTQKKNKEKKSLHRQVSCRLKVNHSFLRTDHPPPQKKKRDKFIDKTEI